VSRTAAKYVLLGLIVLVIVAGDQWSKMWADDWLASPYTEPPNPVVFAIDAADDGKPLAEAMAAVLTGSKPPEIERMIRRYTRVAGKRPTGPDQVANAGDEVRISYRAIEVVPEFFHFKYARNPGAAFGLMNDLDPTFRKWFFVCVSLLAVGLIVTLYRNVREDQRLLQMSLALILAGAIGNFIDRVRFQYVIDFIDWHWKDVYHWPTFNVADSAITVGVAILFLEMFFGDHEEEDGGKGGADAKKQSGGAGSETQAKAGA
jgi:signal peptidase II